MSDGNAQMQLYVLKGMIADLSEEERKSIEEARLKIHEIVGALPKEIGVTAVTIACMEIALKT